MKPKIYCSLFVNPQPEPVLSQEISIYIATWSFYKINFNIVVPSGLYPSSICTSNIWCNYRPSICAKCSMYVILLGLNNQQLRSECWGVSLTPASDRFLFIDVYRPPPLIVSRNFRSLMALRVHWTFIETEGRKAGTRELSWISHGVPVWRQRTRNLVRCIWQQQDLAENNAMA
jgi:hypothetical protein